jgi:tetratricopeptide (TPR) repeat protein
MSRALRGIVTFLAGGLLFVAAASVRAQQGDCGGGRDPGIGTLDEWTWERLGTVYEAVDENRLDEAHADLQEMLDRAGSDQYLQAVLNQVMGQVEWARADYDRALGYLETAVELDTLPDATHYALLYQIAQLHFRQYQPAAALSWLEAWFCAVPAGAVTSAAWVLKASILARLTRYADALEAIDTAIGMDRKPKEPWYQLKLAAHFELGQFPEAAATLERLISMRPDRKYYWTQLSQIRFRLNQDQRALAVQALAWRMGLLDEEKDVTYLASLYSHLKMPYKAADVLQRGIRDGIVSPSSRHWARVADAWYAAGELEPALSAFREAGAVAADGRVDLRRGYVLVDLERWLEAREALDQALARGGLDDRQTGEAYLLRGVAQFNIGELDGAGQDWTLAGGFETAREAARQWMSFLREERRRRSS